MNFHINHIFYYFRFWEKRVIHWFFLLIVKNKTLSNNVLILVFFQIKRNYLKHFIFQKKINTSLKTFLFTHASIDTSSEHRYNSCIKEIWLCGLIQVTCCRTCESLSPKWISLSSTIGALKLSSRGLYNPINLITRNLKFATKTQNIRK